MFKFACDDIEMFPSKFSRRLTVKVDHVAVEYTADILEDFGGTYSIPAHGCKLVQTENFVPTRGGRKELVVSLGQ
jgi:hypothetical protein